MAHYGEPEGRMRLEGSESFINFSKPYIHKIFENKT